MTALLSCLLIILIEVDLQNVAPSARLNFSGVC